MSILRWMFSDGMLQVTGPLRWCRHPVPVVSSGEPGALDSRLPPEGRGHDVVTHAWLGGWPHLTVYCSVRFNCAVIARPSLTEPLSLVPSIPQPFIIYRVATRTPTSYSTATRGVFTSPERPIQRPLYVPLPIYRPYVDKMVSIQMFKGRERFLVSDSTDAVVV